MKTLFTIALLTAGLQALHLNTDNSISTIAHSTITDDVVLSTTKVVDVNEDDKPAHEEHKDDEEHNLEGAEDKGSNSVAPGIFGGSKDPKENNNDQGGNLGMVNMRSP